ncbi:MAG: hypothetical protein ACREIA_09940 [Opitutaceae bacterium]
MPYTSIIVRPLQTAITARLAGLDDLKDEADALVVPVLTRLEKNITNEIQAAVNMIGICIEVWPALFTQIRQNANGLFSESIITRLRIIDNPIVNETGLDSAAVAELCLYYLHLWDPAVSGLSILCAAESPIQFIESPDAVMLDLFFECSGGFAVRAS